MTDQEVCDSTYEGAVEEGKCKASTDPTCKAKFRYRGEKTSGKVDPYLWVRSECTNVDFASRHRSVRINLDVWRDMSYTLRIKR